MIIPGTTLLYTLPISVMVAMVIMRGSIIVISRLIDAVQIKQGILKRKVYGEENWAVVFALLAVGANLLPVPLAPWFEQNPAVAKMLGIDPGKLKGGFDFVHNPLAMWVLGAYIVSYAVRLYLMNYFKNTRKGPADVDNRGYFALEQLAASAVIFGTAMVVWLGVKSWGWSDPRLVLTHDAVQAPNLAAVATLVERTTRFGKLVRVESKKADHVAEQLSKAAGQLPADLMRSLTWDQGTEMAAHEAFTVNTGVKVYFCDPRSPWQRPTTTFSKRPSRSPSCALSPSLPLPCSPPPPPGAPRTP